MNLIRRNPDEVEVLSDYGWKALPPTLLEEQELQPLGKEITSFLGGSIIDVTWEYFLLVSPLGAEKKKL